MTQDDDRAGRFVRVAFLVLAFGQGLTALWALGAPRSFYDDFPGGGREWVSAHPPYNEHLIVDYGSGALALTVLAVLAAVSLQRRVVQVTAIGWICFGLPHFLYHVVTAGRLPAVDGVASAVTQGMTVAIPLAILATLRGRPVTAGAVAGRAAS